MLQWQWNEAAGSAHARFHGGLAEGRVAVGLAHGAALGIGRAGRCGRRPRVALGGKRQFAHAADRGARGTSIVWTTSNENVIDVDGTVTRPNVGEGDQVVMLTAIAEVQRSNYQPKLPGHRAAAAAIQSRGAVRFREFADRVPRPLRQGQATGNRLWNTGAIGFDAGHRRPRLAAQWQQWRAAAAGLITQLRIHGVVLDQSHGHHALHDGLLRRRSMNGSTAPASRSPRSGCRSCRKAGMATRCCGAAAIAGSTAARACGSRRMPGVTWRSRSTRAWCRCTSTACGDSTPAPSRISSARSPGIFALGVNYWDLPFNGLIDELKFYEASLSGRGNPRARHRPPARPRSCWPRRRSLLDLGDLSAVREDLEAAAHRRLCQRRSAGCLRIPRCSAIAAG